MVLLVSLLLHPLLLPLKKFKMKNKTNAIIHIIEGILFVGLSCLIWKKICDPSWFPFVILIYGLFQFVLSYVYWKKDYPNQNGE